MIFTTESIFKHFSIENSNASQPRDKNDILTEIRRSGGRPGEDAIASVNAMLKAAIADAAGMGLDYLNVIEEDEFLILTKSIKGVKAGIMRAFLQERRSGGPFKSWEEVVKRTRGIGPARLQNLMTLGRHAPETENKDEDED